MKLINKGKRKSKRPLKLLKTGLEAEFYLIDEKGKVAYEAPKLIKAVKSKYEDVEIVPEIGKNMIEFGCYPDIRAYNPILDMLDSVEKAYNISRKKGLYFYPFSTYPGKFEPIITNASKYRVKEKIFGEKRILNSMKAVGFHHHYSLPKGVFDEKTKTLKIMKNSTMLRSMISWYNFEIAADPALTLLTQSSPFFEGNQIAKDSRLLIYRGGRKLQYPDGLYAKFQQFGALPPYKFTVTDLQESFNRRVARWRSVVKKADPRANFDDIYPYKLDISWNPVKINKLGTIEQRGMDMNLFSVIVPVTIMIKHCLEKLQNDFIEVIPADHAIDDPFKLENGILYVPPHTYVRNQLQYYSAYEGYDNKILTKYTKRFLRFAQAQMPDRYKPLFNNVVEMVENKKSMSDRIIQYAKYKGYLKDNRISNSHSADLALYYAEHFEKDLYDTKVKLEQVAFG